MTSSRLLLSFSSPRVLRAPLFPLLMFTHTSHDTWLFFYDVIKMLLGTVRPWWWKLNIKWNYKYFFCFPKLFRPIFVTSAQHTSRRWWMDCMWTHVKCNKLRKSIKSFLMDFSMLLIPLEKINKTLLFHRSASQINSIEFFSNTDGCCHGKLCSLSI